jgi:hypothetical protein
MAQRFPVRHDSHFREEESRPWHRVRASHSCGPLDRKAFDTLFSGIRRMRGMAPPDGGHHCQG